MSTARQSIPTILVIMGVSGSGKSTLAQALSDRLGWVFQEGDALHPAANIAKMRAAIPLTDDDRWPWLGRVREWIQTQQGAGRPGIVTCSALRRSYRAVLAGPGVVFVHLVTSREELAQRLNRRTGHFMPAALLESQLETLEPLRADENGFVIDATLPAQEKVQRVLAELRQQQIPFGA